MAAPATTTAATAAAQPPQQSPITLQAAARRVGVTPRYLREILRRGVKSYYLAERLETVIGRDLNELLRGGIVLPAAPRKSTQKGGALRKDKQAKA